MNAYSPVIAVACVAIVAPACYGQQEAAQKPTMTQIFEGMVAILNGAADVLKEAKDAETAAVAAEGIKELNKLAAGLDLVSDNVEPTEEEMAKMNDLLGAVKAAALKVGAEVVRLSECDFESPELDAAFEEFAKITDLESLLETEEEEEEAE